MKKSIILFLAAFVAAASANAQEVTDTLVNFPWGQTRNYYQITGNTVTVSSEQLEKRAMGDLRNRMTGMVNGMEVTETGGSFIAGATGGLNSFSFGTAGNSVDMKGFAGAKAFIDDISIPFSQLLLDPNQIESITVLSDVLDKAKYGPLASYGGIYIKTKKGGYDTPLRLSFDVEAGLNMVDRVPEWVNGAEYAELNNAARAADGYTALYSEDAIAGYKLQDPYDIYYPSVNYKSLMMKDMFMAEQFGFTATAGTSKIKYNIALNAMHSGDIRTGGTNDFNKLNLVANIGTRIGNWVEAKAGFQGLLVFRQTNRNSWYNYRSVPANAYPLNLFDVPGTESDRTIYGVSKTWTDNYYAKQVEGGYKTYRNRSANFYADLDVNWGFWVKGLKSTTKVQTSSFMSTILSKDNDYLAYYWDPNLPEQEISDHKGEVATGRSISSNSTSQIFSFFHKFFYNWQKNGHNIDAGLSYYMYSGAQTGDAERQRQQYFIGDVSWNYKNRYTVEFVANEAGSSRWKGASRWAFLPSAGLGWVISNESWMKGASAIDNLKVHAQAGIIGDADVFGTGYLYQSKYSLTTGMLYGPTSLTGAQWFGKNTHTSKYTTINRLANEGLTWPKIEQIDAGIDIDLLGCLSARASVYTWKRTGLLADVMNVLPVIYGLGNVSIIDNFEEETSLGYDFNVNFHKQWGDFGFRAGVDVFNWNRKYSRLANDVYSEEYQKKTGTSVYAVWGLDCIGKYETQEQIDENPSYISKSALKIGDLMYRDVNGDGNIDANDRVIIGNNNPKLRYSVNLGFTWKDLDFQVVGTGRLGGDLQLTNEYFWNGWGDGNYSAFVRDNIGVAYPNLSYVKSTNNFVLSDFWLTDGSWFKIQNVEVGYNLHIKPNKEGTSRSIRFSIKGENLCTFTKVKYVDPEAISTGITQYPLFRLVTIGAKFNF